MATSCDAYLYGVQLFCTESRSRYEAGGRSSPVEEVPVLGGAALEGDVGEGELTGTLVRDERAPLEVLDVAPAGPSRSVGSLPGTCRGMPCMVSLRSRWASWWSAVPTAALSFAGAPVSGLRARAQSPFSGTVMRPSLQRAAGPRRRPASGCRAAAALREPVGRACGGTLRWALGLRGTGFTSEGPKPSTTQTGSPGQAK